METVISDRAYLVYKHSIDCLSYSRLTGLKNYRGKRRLKTAPRPSAGFAVTAPPCFSSPSMRFPCEEIEKLIQERQEARKNKDFARADQIRDELMARGILLKDTRQGLTWKRA